MVGHVVAEAHDSRLVATGSTLGAQVIFLGRAKLRASHIPEPTTYQRWYVTVLLVLTWLLNPTRPN